MTASIRALLEGLIDYAGVFPPATLPVAEAARNFARYRGGADAWMLARFVFPARRLAELAAFAASLLSVIGPSSFCSTRFRCPRPSSRAA